MKMITVTTNIEVRSDRVEAVYTNVYQKDINDFRVNVKVFLVSGSCVEDNVDFGPDGDTANEWCDIIKDDIYRAVENA